MKHHNDKRTAPPAATCWQREAPSACLRIEVSGRETYLFPYQHLVSASLSLGDNEAETLRLAFSSHDVEVTGRNLRGLLSALQDFAVKWIRAMPERYAPVERVQDGLIFSIHVTEAP